MSEPEARALLEGNLAALRSAGSDLAERLCWPARSSHVGRTSDGRWLRKGMCVSLTPEELGGLEVERSGPCPSLLGVGLGEQVAWLLEASRGRRVRAWDRDPWLLRQALSVHDFREPLAQGRLELGLGSDLIDWLEQDPQAPFSRHPRLGGLYRMESALVHRGVRGPRVGIGLDQLLAEEVADALHAEGYAVCPLDFESWSLEELDRAARRTRALGIVSINYVPDLVGFCHARGLRYLCWEIDPTTETRPRLEGPSQHCSVWTYRRAHVPLFEQAGFSHVGHLPLGSDPERRRPPEGEPPAGLEDLRVAFVGSSLEPEAARARGRLLDLYAAWHADGMAAREDGARRLDRALEQQAAAPERDLLEEALGAELGAFVEHLRRRGEREDPVALAAQLAAAQKRRRYVAALRDPGVDVWGDPGWEATAGEGVRYRGYAGHHYALPWIYARAPINLDIGRLYQSDIVTLRVFDVLACGGFVLAEHSPDLDALFEVGREVESYVDLADLRQKVTHYLAHPEQRHAIARRGQAAVRERHTVRARVQRALGSWEPPARAAPPQGDDGDALR